MASPFFTTAGEAENYAKRLDPYFQSLERDMYANLVYARPEEVRKHADIVATLPGEATKKQAEELRKQADMLESRAKGKSAEQIEKEVSFSRLYASAAHNGFMPRWEFFMEDQVGHVHDLTGPLPGAVWEQTEAFETEFKRHRQGYEALGFKPSSGLPPTNEEIEKEHESDGPFKLSTLLWIGAIGVGAFVVYDKLVKPSSPQGLNLTVAAPALREGEKDE